VRDFRKEYQMPQEKLSVVLRILDSETQLIERADKKAIALLSIVGVFMVFFIVYYRLVPVNPVTVTLTASYFVFAILSIVSLVMTVRPRIHRGEGTENQDVEGIPPHEPAFFDGIRKFPSLEAYRKVLGEMMNDESAVFNIYSRQIFNLAQINAAKYKHLHRATFITIAALAIELTIIIYLFASYMGAGIMPPII
jgi:hypothetical protein